MFIFKLLSSVVSRVDQVASADLAIRSTHHLDDHLLADIGFYRESGRLYPLAGQPENRLASIDRSNSSPVVHEPVEGLHVQLDSVSLER